MNRMRTEDRNHPERTDRHTASFGRARGGSAARARRTGIVIAHARVFSARHLPVAIVLLTLLPFGPESSGAPEAAARSNAIAFSDDAPDSTGLFITVSQLGELSAALDRAHAWQLFTILSGGSPDHARPLDLPRALSNLLGLRRGIDMAAFSRSEVGIALPTPLDLGAAAWFVRLPDRGALDDWLPHAQRVKSGSIGRVRYFQLRNGSKAAVRGDVVSIGRRWKEGSFFDQTLRVMTGRGDPLARSTGFRDLAVYLPANYLAVSYLAGGRSDTGTVEAPLAWWPAAQEMVIGLYEGEGRLDIAIRASLVRPESKPGLSRAAVDRLLQLPQTTLFAAATTTDFANLRRAGGSTRSLGLLERYLAFLAGLQGQDASVGGEVPRLGPHVILAWGQDLRAGRSTPQVALMIECDGGRTIQRRVHDMVDGLLKFTRVLEPDSADATPVIVRSRHVGANIFSVPLATFAGKSELPFMKVVADASPAWTVWNGWLILAAHREHIERILDAQYGLVPVLGAVNDVRELRLRESDRSAVSIVQPDLATEVLEEWLASYDAGAPSLLDPVWWGGQPRTGAGGRTSLIRGVELMEQTTVVVVKSVNKDSAAGGRLARGDRILGIDGSLLPTNAPLADLAARWKKSRNRAGPTLRIQRGESLVDVIVPKNQKTERIPRRRIDAAGAVREIAALGRTLEFGSYAVDVSPTGHYSARVSLRFRAGQVTKANAK